jgi:endonuclease/exonuclease/phosphatase family metal-dependent hydrolase
MRRSIATIAPTLATIAPTLATVATTIAAAAVAVIATGCMNHGFPKDTHVEAVFPPTPAAAELPRELRVVTFNVEMKPGPMLLDAIQHDRALRDADLIILEEVHRSHLGCSAACVIARALGFASVYAPGHANGDGDDGVAILSRAPITSAQVIVLPHYDVHLNGGRRIALAATIQRDGKPITVYAVHLENRITAGQRARQMMPVLAHAAVRTTPVIMGGDFNTSPFTWIAHLVPILTTTQGPKLEKLVRAHGLATPVAESGPTSRFLGMRLDGIYTRGFETTRFATTDAGDVSDHIALWAVMH